MQVFKACRGNALRYPCARGVGIKSVGTLVVFVKTTGSSLTTVQGLRSIVILIRSTGANVIIVEIILLTVATV